jgi:hypothetical protein
MNAPNIEKYFARGLRAFVTTGGAGGVFGTLGIGSSRKATVSGSPPDMLWLPMIPRAKQNVLVSKLYRRRFQAGH